MTDERAFHVFDTALGPMAVMASAVGLVRVVLRPFCPTRPTRLIGPTSPGGKVAARAARQLKAYAAGRRTTFDVPLDLGGLSAFARRVLRACAAIPLGQWRTYGQLAAAAGAPRAARAVGQVLRRNRFPIIVPCHRVVGADGRLTGFSARGGLALKRRLLAQEGITVRNGRVPHKGAPGNSGTA